jgi:ubiquinone/menaquinone biosynthesis C-methylase UbiE
MTMTEPKPYKGFGMEGPIALWYAKNTRKDTGRFERVARNVAESTPVGASVLEIAPGPGYLAIEIARSGRTVTTLDISKTFVQIAKENALRAGVAVDARHGSASSMPFPDNSFDFAVCVAAFKNFTAPLSAINEIHRVLVPGGEGAIYDLRKDAAPDEIAAEVDKMGLSAWSTMLTRWIFRYSLLKRAYTQKDLERMLSVSRFQSWNIEMSGIGFVLRMRKER